jgi:hypothetical protein
MEATYSISTFIKSNNAGGNKALIYLRTTLKYIRNFRKIINLSIKNDWLEKDPFKAYQVKLKDTKRTFLNKEELTRIEEKPIGIERLENVRDIFVFCCYTGLSYVDVEKLTKHQIVKGLDGVANGSAPGFAP